MSILEQVGANTATKQKAQAYDNMVRQSEVESLAAQRADMYRQQDRLDILNSMAGLRAMTPEEQYMSRLSGNQAQYGQANQPVDYTQSLASSY